MLDGVTVVRSEKASWGWGYTNLILLNPTKGDYKILFKPILDIRTSVEGFGLYYGSSDNDYKLLHVTTRFEFQMYSLKPDLWRRLVADLDKNFIMKFWSTPSVWLNENLYF